MEIKIKEIGEKIKKAKIEIAKKIVWQEELIESLFIWIFSNWHILLEWVPGLAKTESIKAISQIIWWDFWRVSFTPDLLPSDVIWWLIFDQKNSEFKIKKWPIFTNLLLWDEINRAPAKVQSALLEAMAEKQVTIWDKTFKLPEPFLVMATQNPIEQEWTFPLPEAQVDRFLMKVKLDYPKKEEEILIIRKNLWKEVQKISKVFDKKEILEIQKLITEVYIDDELINYITKIVWATREIKKYIPELEDFIEYWASPRASISLAKSVQVNAILEWRDYATPDDVKKLAKRILRHRIWLSYRAEAEKIDQDKIIQLILDSIKLA